MTYEVNPPQEPNPIHAKIRPILEKIKSYTLLSPKFNELDLQDWLANTVNGDEITTFISVPVNFTTDAPGILTYILTNTRIIKITIQRASFSASSVYLNKVVRLNRETTGQTAEMTRQSIEFSEGPSFGLGYPKGDTYAETFFQAVDEAIRNQKQPQVT